MTWLWVSLAFIAGAMLGYSRGRKAGKIEGTMIAAETLGKLGYKLGREHGHEEMGEALLRAAVKTPKDKDLN